MESFGNEGEWFGKREKYFGEYVAMIYGMWVFNGLTMGEKGFKKSSVGSCDRVRWKKMKIFNFYNVTRSGQAKPIFGPTRPRMWSLIQPTVCRYVL